MRYGWALCATLLAAGCLDDTMSADGILDEPEDEVLSDVLRKSGQALLDKDVDYLVDHHADIFCNTSDGEQITKAELRKMLQRLFANEWDAVYGDARTPDDVWRYDEAEIRNFSEVQAEPEWAPYDDICDFRPEDQAVVVPKATNAKVPNNFTGFYRLMDHKRVRVRE